MGSAFNTAPMKANLCPKCGRDIAALTVAAAGRYKTTHGKS
jgi:hypothetical protein